MFSNVLIIVMSILMVTSTIIWKKRYNSEYVARIAAETNLSTEVEAAKRKYSSRLDAEIWRNRDAVAKIASLQKQNQSLIRALRDNNIVVIDYKEEEPKKLLIYDPHTGPYIW